MRNINHIQLKDLEEVDINENAEEELHESKEYKKKFKSADEDFDYSQGMSRSSLKNRFRNLLHTLTATNTRKSVLLLIMAISVITFTIVISTETKSREPVEQQGQPFVFTNNRLPTWITPIQYLLNVNVDLNAFTFNGTNVITLNITKDDNFIVIHSENLKIDTVELQPIQLADYQSYPRSTDLSYNQEILIPDKIIYDTNNSYNIIYFKRLPQLINDGNQYFNLKIAYHANLTDSLRGLYRSHYSYENETKWLAITQFEPTDARAAMPCFDEPQLKANWTIWLNIDQNYTALSNMPERSSQDLLMNRKLVKFETTPVMSSYLVCMIVHQFDHIELTVNGDKNGIQKSPITFRVWSAPYLMDSAQYALEIAKNSTLFYIKYFGIAYPLPKMDLVAIPDFAAGAMENWGCITFRQTDLLYDPQIADVDNKARVAEVVAHEIAHQWFGDLTTMVWWTDLWLNEGFSTFMSFKAMSAIISEFNSNFDFIYEIKQTGMKMDGQITTHPISNNFTNPVDIEGAFDSITYDKGASIISMLESLMQVNGVDYFQIGIHNYLTKYSYSNAATADLWDSLYKAVKPVKDLNIALIMKNWTSEPGFPYLSITTIQSQYVITQQRFIESDESNSPPSYNWYVPLTYQTQCGLVNNNTLFSTKTYHMNIQPQCHDLMLLNPMGKGFYRTQYSHYLYDLIIQNLKANNTKVSPLGKLTFIDDSFHFVQAGLLKPSRILTSLDYLREKFEDNPVIWKTVIKGLNYFTDRVYAEEYYQLYENYIQNIIQQGLVNNVPIDNNNHNLTYNMASLQKITVATAATYNNQQIITQLYQIWLLCRDNVSLIQNELRGAMYRSIVKNGGEEEYNWVYKRYKSTNSINERIDALRALGNPKTIYLIYRSLNMLLNNEVRFQDFGDLISQLSYNPYAIDKTWRFMRDNFHYFKDKLLPADLAKYYQIIGNNFNSEGLLNEYEAFFKDKMTLLPSSTIKNTIEAIKNNIAWIKTNSNDIQNFLNGNPVVDDELKYNDE
ncbi:hypothetical protein DLAC_08802 [Tieghemostelium lacteum]|uniref:Aminopeptidase n=1 Tax=Tieghemostelium lacteum TaxID=361077 RepID=A0A151Z8A6_TIELA|nr:hypothetical protein DLAC_08802 [Tieghemostelium lacteum]|eukprot:KYQ90203.1 hypothetical protein DLAC_08802 [Tieghemostelium lacteum]